MQKLARNVSTLRALPWQFPLTGEGPVIQGQTAEARFNLRMVQHADSAQFPQCFAVAAEMKKEKVAPSRITYNTLLRSLAHGGHASATLAVLEDMVAMEIKPDVTAFNFIVHAHRTQVSPFLHSVLRRMENMEVPPNATTYALLISRFAQEQNLEVCLAYLREMQSAGLVPQLATIQSVIILAAEKGWPRLAIDLAESYERTTRKVEDSVWHACLQASASQLYAEGVTKCWNLLVKDLAVLPDEGLCLLVLNTAARHGLPDLATDVMRILQILEVPWEEAHLAALFEALFVTKRYEESFDSLAIMRQNDLIPTLQTAYPIVAAIVASPPLLDELWTVILQMKDQNKFVDPSIGLALLQASVATQPLSRALGDNESLIKFGFEPSLEAFAILLDACISSGNLIYGELVYQQAKQAGVDKDAASLERMIALHLSRNKFDGAFRYLDLMEINDSIPSKHICEVLALTAADAHDPRYLLAIDAMKRAQYPIEQTFLDKCLEQYRRRQPAQVSKEAGLDPVAKKFIETGGL
ncbi:Methyltransf-25 domain-containing protein [Mycena indigotica]|uniref:Methyltransf-25 domain-containing protein n=1 Tax=Mycena indigotica TaxID=2126181 RepID=A0A8H6TET6_9AGAR|nr:Methyltransf-25 domain-containing protein [Mycena indigotica]KAF7315387.1 Methyltransf-25 domain-containing protein [Mycena indigotica]